MFELNTAAVSAIVVIVIGGSTAGGLAVGRRFRERPTAREALSVAQAALLGFIALLLTFGLTMAVGRYEKRREAVVHDANTIGTAYLRAQTLPGPMRSSSLQLLSQYADLRVALSRAVPGSGRYRGLTDESASAHRQLWQRAGTALAQLPDASAPHLYAESLNSLMDADASRRAALADVIPSSVLYGQILASAAALAVLSAYLGIVGRSAVTPILAAVLVCVILMIIIDLDRPVRGVVKVSVAPLEQVQATIRQGPSYP